MSLLLSPPVFLVPPKGSDPEPPSDTMLWDDGTPMLWDDSNNLLWDDQ